MSSNGWSGTAAPPDLGIRTHDRNADDSQRIFGLATRFNEEYRRIRDVQDEKLREHKLETEAIIYGFLKTSNWNISILISKLLMREAEARTIEGEAKREFQQSHRKYDESMNNLQAEAGSHAVVANATGPSWPSEV